MRQKCCCALEAPPPAVQVQPALLGSSQPAPIAPVAAALRDDLRGHGRGSGSQSLATTARAGPPPLASLYARRVALLC